MSRSGERGERGELGKARARVFGPLAALLLVVACGRNGEAPVVIAPAASASAPRAIAPAASSTTSDAASVSDAGAGVDASTTTAAIASSSSTPPDARCTACCEEESRSCDAECAPGEAGRGCLRQCGSRRISCFQGCAGGPDDMGCRNAKAKPAPSTSSGPVSIPCTSDADCWYDDTSGRVVPIRRPSSLRSKQFRPCVDRGAVPACRGGACTILRYKC